MLKLYHGTNTTFEKVELSKCLPYKDFGRGFYLTTIRPQALGRARDKCQFEGGTPTILTFLFEDKELINLNVNTNAVSNTSAKANDVKRIVNAQLLILREGKTYNVQGVEVK